MPGSIYAKYVSVSSTGLVGGYAFHPGVANSSDRPIASDCAAYASQDRIERASRAPAYPPHFRDGPLRIASGSRGYPSPILQGPSPPDSGRQPVNRRSRKGAEGPLPPSQR